MQIYRPVLNNKAFQRTRIRFSCKKNVREGRNAGDQNFSFSHNVFFLSKDFSSLRIIYPHFRLEVIPFWMNLFFFQETA